MKESLPTNSCPPLRDDVVAGFVDHKGRPVYRSSYGGWRSASRLIGVGVAERIIYFGIECNLITFLTGHLGQSVATAAENVNVWSGMSRLLPLLGAFVADSFLGRYRTILYSSLLYILGLGFLTLSTLLLSLNNSDCQITDEETSCSSKFPFILFFVALYLVVFALGGLRPCIQAFAADQFDDEDSEERKEKSSFFNWWYFSTCGGIILSILILSYIQDNISWVLGYGILCIVMILALVVFLLETKTFRLNTKRDEENPFVRIGRVFVAAIKNRRTTCVTVVIEEEARGTLHIDKVSEQFKFLNKALVPPNDGKCNGKVCSISEVDEAKQVLRLVPIWATSLVFGVIFSQSTTFYTKQGVTLDRTITRSFQLPPAMLQSFTNVAVFIFIPIYVRIIIPLARVITKKPSGITVLQRIGTGMVISTLSMIIAALVEMKRLKTAREHGLIDLPNVTIPMCIWWMVPQYFLFGVAEAFTLIGLQEFFYHQVPDELRSVGVSLSLSVIGVGSFISSFLVLAIEKITIWDGGHSWFDDNLNKAHLDYYYWLLAGLNTVGVPAFVFFARSYVYRT